MVNQPTLSKGMTSRPARMADLDAALELFNLCSQNIIGANEFTRASLESDWTTPGFNLETDSLAVFSSMEELIAFKSVNAASQPPVHPWVWGRVHPAYQSSQLGSYLFKWAEKRAQLELAAVLPEARVSIFSGAWETDKFANQMMVQQGLSLIRHSYQMRVKMSSRPQPNWPKGIHIRTFEMDDLEAVYQADEEIFRDHFGYIQEDYQAGLARFRHRVTSDLNFDPQLWFLAMDGDQLAGICLCRKNSWEDETMGWVRVLGVRRLWRSRGLGLALLQNSFSAFWQRGKRQVGLGVDAQNLTGALKLYKKAGMNIHRKFNLYEKELRPGKELANLGLE